MLKRGRLTVGSLRGVPQGRAAVPRAPLNIATRGPTLDVTKSPGTSKMSAKRPCCGTGCAGCPVGERIRALRLARRS